MQIFVPKEARADEKRAPLLPETAEKLTALGAVVEVEQGIGRSINVSDEDYKEKGASISGDRSASLAKADIVLRLGKPPGEDVTLLKAGAVHISFLDPFNEHDLLKQLAAADVTAISMEMIPRTTLAQKMDALSSQANLTGYAAVILGADKLDRLFPMMMTPAGTLAPARVFIIGVGVAGLQAIATAKRLGARVDAFDTRPAVEEQVKSLGGRFVKIDLGETGQTKDGYAKALTDEQIARQREQMGKHCASSDVVITTAQVFGRRAPVIVTADMLAGMRPGSVVIDCAVDTGGNVEGVSAGEVTSVNGVHLVGLTNMPGLVAYHASQAYSSNLGNLLEHFWDEESKSLKVDMDDEIMQGCVIARGGEIVNETIRNLSK